MPQVDNLRRKTRPAGRGFSFVLFGAALSWAFASEAVAAKAARGLSGRFGLSWGEALLSGLFWLFLLVLGLSLLDWISGGGGSLETTLFLPRRTGWVQEWGLGAAVGWGMALAILLPILLSGNLHSHLAMEGRGLGLALVGLAALAVVTLAEELVFRGYAFRRLIATLGPTWASLLMSLLFSLAVVLGNAPSRLGIAIVGSMLFGLVLSLGYLRTHALWVSWGVHFAYRAVAAVVFGLPVAGRLDFGALADTSASGPAWLTGGAFGPDAAAITLIVMLAGFAVLYRLTRTYAWEYTHAPIVAGGYEVTVPHPAAHVAMEQQAAPPPLVQILPVTPQNRSLDENVSRYEHPSG